MLEDKGVALEGLSREELELLAKDELWLQRQKSLIMNGPSTKRIHDVRAEWGAKLREVKEH